MAQQPQVPDPTQYATTPLKYYTNSRGVNYLPIMTSEWEDSGWLPRIAGLGYDASNSFRGTNKTAQWWYYNHEDNKQSVKMLRELGMNSLRVFIDMYVWARRRDRFIADLKDFMKICDKNKMRVQLVLFDFIEILPEAAQPSVRAQTFSSVEHGLQCSWHRVPHDFEVSSQAQLNSFYTTCAVPYVGDICSSVSSFQSLWSFDIINEPSGLFFNIVSSVGPYVSSLLSSVGIGITFGHGSSYDAYPGLTPPHPAFPNEILQLSASINFVSPHFYVTNSFLGSKILVDEALSGARMIGRPGMYNEAANPVNGNYVYKNVEYFNSALNYGGLTFDGLIDYGFGSYEPFRDLQGILFADGQARLSEDAEAYSRLAVRSGWLRPSQVKLHVTQKDVGEGGYASGVAPEHSTFLPSVFVSANEFGWNFSKALFYASINAVNPGASIKYTPFAGHPYQQDNKYGFIASGYDLGDYINIVRNYSSFYLPFSSVSGSYASNFQEVNRQFILRDLVITAVELPNLLINPLLPQAPLIGTVYDKVPIPSSIRLDFSAHYYSASRTDGNSIVFGLNNTASTSGSAPCVATSSCLYNTPGVPQSGINFGAYQEWYDTTFIKLNTCIDYLLSSTNTEYPLML
jgi:hypothetical protein